MTITDDLLRQTHVVQEDFTRAPGPLEVDRATGIIFGVKVLGWESDNGRRYLPEAGQLAVPLYEGCKVFLDHPDKRALPRGDEDAFGRLLAVRWEPDGVYGDLHFFKSHPLAERVCEDVERGLGVFGMSHNAKGEGESVDGTFVIHRIVEVRSVDLVSEPATVKNLWDSKMPTRCERIRTILESKLLTPGQRHSLKKLLKASKGDDGEKPPTHHDHLLNAVEACLKEDMDPHERHHKVSRIMELLNPKPACKQLEEDEADEEEGQMRDDKADVERDDDRTDRGDKDRPDFTDEARYELEDDLADLRLDRTIQQLCETRSIPCTDELLETLTAIQDEDRIARHLDYLKQLRRRPRTTRQARSQLGPPQPLQESIHATIPRDAKSRLQWLMN
ncbi:MAG TPA: hypothetical protein VK395_22290 [Gemmataceae bacterium]|nr:hypothetical protein [Gemmataceae bacterium]